MGNPGGGQTRKVKGGWLCIQAPAVTVWRCSEPKIAPFHVILRVTLKLNYNLNPVNDAISRHPRSTSDANVTHCIRCAAGAGAIDAETAFVPYDVANQELWCSVPLQWAGRSMSVLELR